MIVDTMSRQEVMVAIRHDFEDYVSPYYLKLKHKYRSQIQAKAAREKKIVTLGWERFVSPNNLMFNILKRGDKEQDLPLFAAEFVWRNRLCFASIYQDDAIIVFQEHCLKRYAERVLHKMLDIRELFYKYLVKKQPHAYNIVLPSPTHKYSIYSGFANALFLGDFDVPDENGVNRTHNWFNTCISINESYASQKNILSILQSMQRTIGKLKFNPLEDNELIKRTNKLSKDDNEAIVTFMKNAYLMLVLHKSYDFPFSALYRDKMQEKMKFINSYLDYQGVDINSLDPYDIEIGVAIPGDLDYRQS